MGCALGLDIDTGRERARRARSLYIYTCIYIYAKVDHSCTHRMDSLKYLEQQSKEYQKHLDNRNKLDKAIKFHQQIKITREIPRQFKPKIPNPISRAISLQEEFYKEYNELFFTHLDKVITQNQVSREIEEGALQAIINQTVKELAQLDKPPNEVQHLYYTFIQNNSISEEKIPAEVKAKFQLSNKETECTVTPHSVLTADTSIPSSSAPQNKKRKNTSQPTATKKRKLHFLEKGQLTQQPRT